MKFKRLFRKIKRTIQGYITLFKYRSILIKDQDWDYDFLLDLIEFKLQKMSKYFHNTRIVENEDQYGVICDKAIAILHAGYKTDIILSKDLGDIRVNDKNADRFFNKFEREFYRKEELSKYWLATVREYKAKALFWKFLHHYIEYLWD